MRTLVTKVAILVVPFLVVAAFVAAVDPFQRFPWSLASIPEAAREQVGRTVNNPLWDVIRNDRAASKNIILGDSKLRIFSPELVREASGTDYVNLSVGGGSANEIVSLFWHAARRAQLENVWIGLNVANFNKRNDRDRIPGAELTAGNPLLYLTNRDVLLASANLFSATYLNGALASETPGMSREDFWRQQVADAALRNFKDFEFDNDAFTKFEQIARYCRDHRIQLLFTILPSHVDIHQKIEEYGVAAVWEALPGRLSSIGETRDYDGDGPLTTDRRNFSDPFHFDRTIAREIAADIWHSRAALGGLQVSGPKESSN